MNEDYRRGGDPKYKDYADPKGHKFAVIFLSILFTILLIGLLSTWYIIEHPPTPPGIQNAKPTVTQYHPPPLPTEDEEFARLFADITDFTGAGTTFYGIEISGIQPAMDGSDEIALFIGKGWDCMLGTEDGCMNITPDGILEWTPKKEK